MITQILTKIFGSANDRAVQKLAHIVAQINALESSVQNLSDDELKAKSNEFRKQIAQGKTLDDICSAILEDACRDIQAAGKYDPTPAIRAMEN